MKLKKLKQIIEDTEKECGLDCDVMLDIIFPCVDGTLNEKADIDSVELIKKSKVLYLYGVLE